MLRGRSSWIFLVAINLTAISCAHTARPPAPRAPAAQLPQEEVLILISDTLRIDTTYHSMEGPYHITRFTIASAEQPDTVWITGMTADVVGADLTPVPVEFFCHANLDYDPLVHHELFNTNRMTSSRLFTLSQGHEAMRFPEGFGIPVRTDEPLYLTSQVLSNNGVDAVKDVRVRIRVHYVRNGERPMKALYLTSAIGAVSTDGHSGHYGMHDDHEVGASTAGVAKGRHEYRDTLGQRFAGHWIVPPGEHRVRTVVTRWLNLDADARVHYVGVHVHPFAQRITLRDMTTGEEVFSSRVTPLEGRVGISKVTDLSSSEGVRLYADHHYELISDYSNPTARDVDAMAVMFLYVRDGQLRALESRTRQSQ
ncbi:MAG TPA: hypothetical protein VGD27_01655 [Longimicrobiales bacterium]